MYAIVSVKSVNKKVILVITVAEQNFGVTDHLAPLDNSMLNDLKR